MQTETAEVAGDVVKDHLGTGRKRCVVLTLSKDENPKTLVMLFPGAATQPTVVLKIGLTPTSAAAVRSEGAALRTVAALDPTLLGGTALGNQGGARWLRPGDDCPTRHAYVDDIPPLAAHRVHA